MSTIWLLHGALGAAVQFDSLTQALSPLHTCKAIDFPGHGVHRLRNEFSIQDFAKNLIQQIEMEAKQPIRVFGYSMGGYVALYAACLRPDLFQSITTLASKFDWNPEMAKRESARLQPVLMEQKIPAFVNQLKQLHQTNWIELVEATARLLTDLGQAPLLTESRLQTIHVPVTLLLGDQDTMVSVEETQRVCQQLQQGQMRMLLATKHPFEQVDTMRLANEIRLTLA